ncbi:MAG: AAA family ATPase [Arcicella sp.]|jgi:hypothetical protein|nr:AAA family ATPase [Arcicella sp.]
MENSIVGRVEEIQILQKTLQSKEAELVAITGRRRIGKTYLTNMIFQENIVFNITGTQNVPSNEQLQNFTNQLSQYYHATLPLKKPDNWTEAFSMLRVYLQSISLEQKKVLFFDELPWLAGQKSGFLSAFGYFWNSWASKQNLVIVICGSAASWMIQKIVNDKGGLHNRITQHLHLEPFTLAETKEYLISREVFYDYYQIVQIYMTMGGIPHYLKAIDGTKSAIQNIDRLCFTKNGLLYDEFNRLYASLFTHSEMHLDIVRILTQKKQGMTRNAIATLSKIKNGGGLSNVLNELILSGFITEILPFGKKKKDKLFRLTDEYSLFYLQFMEANRQQGKNIWQHLSQTSTFSTWAGYAFESICLKHVESIKKVMGISGIYSSASSFYQKGTSEQEGVQIDLLIDRNDHIINLFEIKYHSQPYTLTKEYAEKLRQKLWRFQAITKTNKQINWVMISNFGLVKNQYSLGLVINDFRLEDLFATI